MSGVDLVACVNELAHGDGDLACADVTFGVRDGPSKRGFVLVGEPPADRLNRNDWDRSQGEPFALNAGLDSRQVQRDTNTVDGPGLHGRGQGGKVSGGLG